nr:MAG TPA: hypothetical protein [Bacteriophage sp.]
MFRPLHKIKKSNDSNISKNRQRRMLSQNSQRRNNQAK